MRLNTIKRYTYYRYIYLILILAVGFDILLINIDGSIGNQTPVITILVLAIALVLIYRGNPVFRYDSDGEVLILDSKEPILGGFLRSNKLYEFPKRKLIGFRIIRWPLRKVLILKIKSKEAKYKTLRVVISSLKSSEVRDLGRSLDSVAKANKKLNLDEHDDD
ncbi:hypothetical protein [Phaeocystidibacter luteus]|uniref:Uncharacterized protein n=1 Tax=Phaeocystidibacter luteus TaxID=911197 RepID=A0A6N6RMN6_9FLAO|nr:hypothetical protein [Phaeocystidibacter luteus]KAB2814850.1 hypothetical protein F8C67_03625 [Phaeocystidibacter luteus]